MLKVMCHPIILPSLIFKLKFLEMGEVVKIIVFTMFSLLPLLR